MDTRASVLGERLARLEVLVGCPSDGEDGHTIFDRLQSLREGLLNVNSRVGDRPESSQVQETAEMLVDLRAAIEILHSDVSLLKQVVAAQP